MANMWILFRQLITLIVIGSAQAMAADCTPFPENLNPQDLISFVRTAKYLKVEDVLCKLPVSLRSSYSIEFYSETGAAQGASIEEPRVHLFNDQMVLTFNGSSRQSAGDEIELGYQDLVHHEAVMVDLNLRGGNPEVRSPDKLGCLACHGSTEGRNTKTRFLFNAAPFWIGFFGADGFGSEGNFTGAKDHGPFYAREKPALDAFKQKALTHPRYKYLLDLQSKVLTDDEASYRENDANGISMYKVHEDRVLGRINLKYAFMLAKLNHDRLASLILNSPNYEQYRYAIFGSLIFCRSTEIFLPEKVQRYHTNEAYLTPNLRGILTKDKLDAVELEVHLNSILNHPNDLNTLGFESTLANPEPSGFWGIYKNILAYESVTAKFTMDGYIRQEFYRANVGYGPLRYLFEGRLEPISMREWSIDPKKGYYRFNNAPGVDDDEALLAPLLRKLDPVLSQEPALAPFDRPMSEVPGAPGPVSELERENACGFLQKASLEALARFTPPTKIKIKESGYSVISQNCTTCHTQNVLGAPTFDLSNRRNFETFVKNTNGGYLVGAICDRISRGEHDRMAMPKVGPLLADEVNAVKDYLMGLGVSAPSCLNQSNKN